MTELSSWSDIKFSLSLLTSQKSVKSQLGVFWFFLFSLLLFLSLNVILWQECRITEFLETKFLLKLVFSFVIFSPIVSLFKIHESEEMLMGKMLAHKYKNLTLEPHNPCEKTDALSCIICIPSTGLGVGSRDVLAGHPGQKRDLRFSERSYHKN